MKGPLEGLLVTDLSRVLSGPWCTMTLGDLGAEVMKVEHPDGDETRGWGPPFVGEESAYFLSTNRNKRSLRLDLGRADHLEVAYRLISRSDIVVENFRPGTAERLGLGEARCRELAPDIIYASISGFGSGSSRPGYDAIIQAVGGLMSITGHPRTGPAKVGVAIADISAGLYTTIGVLAALVARERTGVGQRVDASLLGSQIAWLANQASNTLNAGVVPGLMGTAHPSIVPYQAFEASDGAFMLAVANDAIWSRFVAALGSPDALGDARFATNPGRVEAREELVGILGGLFASEPRTHWLSMLDAAEVPSGPINDLSEVFGSEEVAALQLVSQTPREDGTSVRSVSFPVHLSQTPASIRRPPPRLGEHDREILAWLGYSEQEVKDLT
ncbi:MAG: CaiB/BaiF CoA transferase family protein, partial [Actinomycetota bacterium]